MGQLCELFPTIRTIETLIVDEADKMFEMGFLEQVDQILVNLPNQVSIAKYMFSATM
jgi:ATP-dependent RNA helicase DeaD